MWHASGLEWPKTTLASSSMALTSSPGSTAMFCSRRVSLVCVHMDNSSSSSLLQQPSPFTKVQAIAHKKRPLVMKLERKADATYKPFELHLARCSKWPSGAAKAMSAGRTMPPANTSSSGYASAEVWAKSRLAKAFNAMTKSWSVNGNRPHLSP